MQAVVRSIQCSGWDIRDIHVNFHVPDDEMFTVDVLIGPKDGPGADVFYVTVTTPLALEKLLQTRPQGTMFAYHYLMVKRYDGQLIREAIESQVQQIYGDDWEQLASRLNTYFAWEFEDSRPGPRSKFLD